MAADEKPTPSTPGAIQRFVRSMSKSKVAQTSSPDPSTTPSDTKEVTANVIQNVKPKLTALERFKSFAVPKAKKQPKVIYPPPSWFEDGRVVNPGASGAAAVPLPPSPERDEGDDPIGNGDGQGDEDKGKRPGDGDQSPPTAAWIASKIKAMIDSLPPLPSSGTSPPTTDTPHDGDGSADHQSPAPIDSNLLKFLSTASIMNGSISKGRQSVWSALERLRGAPPPSDVERDGGPDEDDDSDDQSVMMYVPIVPTAKSKVEIAHSHTEFVPVENISQRVEEFSQEKVGISTWSWPFGWGKGKGESSNGSGSKPPPSDGTPSSGKGKTPTSNPKMPKLKKVTVWEPSTTSLSFQAMWWGYRLYLPPPVLLILNDKALEGAKRAAIITTALKWMVDHIPVAMLPPQLRPVVIVLQRLVPIVGYVGAFIAWSWSAIQSFDKGHGVILTATWLLPVALIPGTWQEKDWPKPPPPPSNPAPAPCPAPAPTQPAPGTGNVPPSSGNVPQTPPTPVPTVPPPSQDGTVPPVTPLPSANIAMKTKGKKK